LSWLAVDPVNTLTQARETFSNSSSGLPEIDSKKNTSQSPAAREFVNHVKDQY
jgi:hypothetical protein